jgi:hypothetical protein
MPPPPSVTALVPLRKTLCELTFLCHSKHHNVNKFVGVGHLDQRQREEGTDKAVLFIIKGHHNVITNESL